MLQEILLNIASNSSFSTEIKYWQNLCQKIKQKIAVNKIEALYEMFVKRNKQQIDKMIQAQKQLEQEETAKREALDKTLKAKVKLSLAEKIKKTALNTGIRFNIMDNLGFDNASLSMF